MDFSRSTPWMIWPDAVGEMLQRAGSRRADMEAVSVTIDDGIAFVELSGVMVPRNASKFYGEVSTEDFADAIINLGANEVVDGIVLQIDSPGGSAAGIPEAADAVAMAAQEKPVIAHIDGLGASAAYYIASQASEIYAAGKNDLIGSIGTIMLRYDLSEMFKQAGIEPVVLATGAYKGTGAPGTKLTDEQREYLQGIVDQVQSGFSQAVSSGRQLSGKRLSAVADGRVFMPSEAQRLGLIDGQRSLSQTVAKLKSQLNRDRSTTMSETITIQPANFVELKHGIPGATADFLCEAQEQKWSIGQAQSTWMERQAEANRELHEKLAAAEKAQKSSLGHDANDLKEGGKGDTADSLDTRAEFESELATELAKPHVKTRMQAVKNIHKRRPELCEALDAAANS